MMIYSGEGLLQTDAVKARGIADFVLMSLSQDKVAIQFAIQIWRIPRRAMVIWLEAITSLSETSYSDNNYLQDVFTVNPSDPVFYNLDLPRQTHIFLIFPLPFYTVVEKLKFPTVSRNWANIDRPSQATQGWRKTSRSSFARPQWSRSRKESALTKTSSFSPLQT